MYCKFIPKDRFQGLTRFNIAKFKQLSMSTDHTTDQSCGECIWNRNHSFRGNTWQKAEVASSALEIFSRLQRPALGSQKIFITTFREAPPTIESLTRCHWHCGHHSCQPRNKMQISTEHWLWRKMWAWPYCQRFYLQKYAHSSWRK